MSTNEKPVLATKLIAGGLAGASETIITYPAEFIKTRRQLPQHAGSALSIVKSTYQTSGFSGFYAGCRALVISNSMKSSIRFFAFETSKDALDNLFPGPNQNMGDGRSKPWVTAIAGLSAGVAESFAVVTPGEALKTRMVEDGARRGGGKIGAGAMVGIIIREEGVGALWRGAIPVMSKQATNSAVRFTSFGILQEQVARRWPGREKRIGTTLTIGAISGIITVYASMPFDNIKTRMQSKGANYSSMLNCAASTLKLEGIGALWRGTTPRLVRLTLSSGITFGVYDQVLRAMKTVESENRQPMAI